MHRLLRPYSLLPVCRFTRADEDPHMASVASLLVDHAKAHARKAAIEIGQYLLHDGSFSADGRGAAGVLAQGTVHVYGAGHATPQCSVAPIANISARRAARRRQLSQTSVLAQTSPPVVPKYTPGRG